MRKKGGDSCLLNPLPTPAGRPQPARRGKAASEGRPVFHSSGMSSFPKAATSMTLSLLLYRARNEQMEGGDAP